MATHRKIKGEDVTSGHLLLLLLLVVVVGVWLLLVGGGASAAGRLLEGAQTLFETNGG